MEKIIRALHLIHDYVQKDENGNIESKNRVLRDISVDIEAGSFVVLLGHNGSGKSTLARHLNALLQPTEGTVWINGHDTKEQREWLEIRKTAGMVFQNPDNQIIASVVEEDVAFGPENMGVPTEEIWQRVAKSLESVDMTAYRYHSPNKLSGGQKQRIAIAGIMAMRPSCMVLDEATAMLDPSGRREVLEAVHRLNKEEKVTVILITHYMEEVIHADRVYVMDSGGGGCRSCTCYGSGADCHGWHAKRGFFQSRGASEIGAGCSPDHGVSLAAETAGNAFFRRYSDPGTVYS